MICAKKIPDYPLCLTIGAFDGIHIGHAALIRETLELARETNAIPTVLTFVPHPVTYFSGKPIPLLTDRMERREILATLGVQLLVELPFHEKLAECPPEDFILEIQKKCSLRGIVAGFNFRFGRGAAGDGKLLKKMGSETGFRVSLTQKVTAEEEVSSSHIRALLEAGEIERATSLLGRPYALRGQVIDGKHLGRTIGFPTLNLPEPDSKVRVPSGVYASRINTKSGVFPAMTNIGYNPTVESTCKERKVESHILVPFTVKQDTISVELLRFMRHEKRFADVTALQQQLEADKRKISAWFGLYKG
ncbi:MAG: riboflavin biosynthesis protein RibF [Christensenellales bacterium]|jgi:riboflavin kinase/FMN adenylyltransferase